MLLRDGKIVAAGSALDGDGATVIDASGRRVAPGIIDVHTHLGVYGSPGATAHQDGNEMIDPWTAPAPLTQPTCASVADALPKSARV